MRANNKIAFRLFKNHITRFFTIIAIVIVSVGFMSGIGEVENKIKISTNDFYISQNVSDLYLKSKNPAGFSVQEIDWIENEFGQENIMKSFCYETKIEDDVIRIYNFDYDNVNINQLQLLEGSMPTNENEVWVERDTTKIKGYNLGDKISLHGSEYTVCGIVLNPLIINRIEEPCFQFEGEYLSNVIYFNSSSFPIINDIYLTIEDRALFNSFSNNYEKEIEKYKIEIEQTIGIENVSVLTLKENFGIYSLISYAEKVGLIGIIFVVFFMLVTLLVVYSTMTRLLDEERSQIACQKTLGYSNVKIVGKYLLFVLVSAVLGGLIAFGVGLVLTQIIYSAFNLQYAMPPFPHSVNFIYYLITFLIIVISTAVLTFITGMKMVKNKPVTLLTPKAPKAGKKVFLEKISFVWNKLSFKYKSTLRNVLLFKSRFFMTVISIIGCATKIDGGSSLITISLALIVFSAVLCALVIYNLTNINISERKREIATLKVLGYQDKEVCGYIFREIYIMGFIGALLGLPLGLGFIQFVFGLIDFGAITDINWWTYVLTPIVVMMFCFLSTLFLKKKITKTDMQSSLKSIE